MDDQGTPEQTSKKISRRAMIVGGAVVVGGTAATMAGAGELGRHLYARWVEKPQLAQNEIRRIFQEELLKPDEEKRLLPVLIRDDIGKVPVRKVPDEYKGTLLTKADLVRAGDMIQDALYLRLPDGSEWVGFHIKSAFTVAMLKDRLGRDAHKLAHDFGFIRASVGKFAEEDKGKIIEFNPGSSQTPQIVSNP